MDVTNKVNLVKSIANKTRGPYTPEKYGIYQSVGDTSGPGGIVRAMRTIPMFEEIAENIINEIAKETSEIESEKIYYIK